MKSTVTSVSKRKGHETARDLLPSRVSLKSPVQQLDGLVLQWSPARSGAGDAKTRERKQTSPAPEKALSRGQRQDSHSVSS